MDKQAKIKILESSWKLIDGAVISLEKLKSECELSPLDVAIEDGRNMQDAIEETITAVKDDEGTD